MVISKEIKLFYF